MQNNTTEHVEYAEEKKRLPEEVVAELSLKKSRMQMEYMLDKEVSAKELSMEMSPQIGNLAAAMSKAQGALSGVSKDVSGYGYKYADIASNFDAIRKPFSDNQLAVVHGHSFKNTDKPSVFTTVMVMHESGEWIKSTLELPVTVMKGLSLPQSVGVVCTYARRYLLQASCGLASEDTDGAAAKPGK